MRRYCRKSYVCVFIYFAVFGCVFLYRHFGVSESINYCTDVEPAQASIKRENGSRDEPAQVSIKRQNSARGEPAQVSTKTKDSLEPAQVSIKRQDNPRGKPTQVSTKTKDRIEPAQVSIKRQTNPRGEPAQVSTKTKDSIEPAQVSIKRQDSPRREPTQVSTKTKDSIEPAQVSTKTKDSPRGEPTQASTKTQDRLIPPKRPGIRRVSKIKYPNSRTVFVESNATCPVVIQGKIPASAKREGFVVKDYPRAKLNPKTGFYLRGKGDRLSSGIVREEIDEALLEQIRSYLPEVWKTYLPLSPDYRNPCRVTRGKAHCLPYFYVLTGAKSGSTDFWYSLELHPLVFTTRKEPHWWTRNKGHGISRYNFFYNNLQKCIEVGADPNIHNYVTGDGSTSTLWDNHLTIEWSEARGMGRSPPFTFADVIRALTPNARLIFLLRNPIERLYSDYWYIYGGKSAVNFDRKVRDHLEVYNSCLKTADERTCVYRHNRGNVGQSALVGLYMVYVRDWLRRFPLDQVLFIRSDDWFRGQKPDILLKTYHFLGIDVTKKEMQAILAIDTLKITIGAENVLRSANVKKKKHPMMESTKTLLETFYAQSNEQLAELTGNDGFLWKD